MAYTLVNILNNSYCTTYVLHQTHTMKYRKFVPRHWSLGIYVKLQSSPVCHTAIITIQIEMTQIVSKAQANASDALACIILLGAVGMICPKVGVIRALKLRWRNAIKSRFWPLNHVDSIRTNKIHEINHALTTVSSFSSVLVTGAPGMGTSCLVNTVLYKRPGVIRLSVCTYYTHQSKIIS